MLKLLLIFLGVSIAHADDVQLPSGHYWSGGLFVARPLKGSLKGFFPPQTLELNVNFGAIDNQPNFLGLNIKASTKIQKIFEEFNQLDPDHSYVFRYEKPHWANPVWNETHILVTEIIKMKTPDAQMPTHIEGSLVRQGSYSSGDRNGVIVEVERWGFWDYTCTLNLNMGGSGHVFQNLVIYGEKACSAAEKLLLYGQEVKVAYTEDYIEIWDAETRIVKSVDVIQSAAKLDSPDEGLQIWDKKMTHSQRDQLFIYFRDRLVNDPDFLRMLDQNIRTKLSNPKPKNSH